MASKVLVAPSAEQVRKLMEGVEPMYPSTVHLRDGTLFNLGISLRVHIATEAMKAFIQRFPRNPDVSDSKFEETITRWSFEMADAMMKESEK